MITLMTEQMEDGTGYIPPTHLVSEVFTELCEEFVYQMERTPTTDAMHWQCAVKLKTRKRQSTLIKDLTSLMKYVKTHPVHVERVRGTWEEAVKYCSKEDSRAEGSSPTYSANTALPYSGKDIEIFKDPKNWYGWQRWLFNNLFKTVPTDLQNGNDRTIIWITDLQGNSGKSKLVKYICFYNKQCAKISFGSAGQLRSSIIHAGSKKCYFVDIPRTLGTDDSIHSIMSALEDTKNGYVTSSYYGESKVLMMEPPHIIVFSNRECPTEMMSIDRWFKVKIRDKCIEHDR